MGVPGARIRLPRSQRGIPILVQSMICANTRARWFRVRFCRAVSKRWTETAQASLSCCAILQVPQGLQIPGRLHFHFRPSRIRAKIGARTGWPLVAPLCRNMVGFLKTTWLLDLGVPNFHPQWSVDGKVGFVTSGNNRVWALLSHLEALRRHRADSLLLPRHVRRGFGKFAPCRRQPPCGGGRKH